MIESILNNLLKGKTILYPTDTVWGLGCDATNEGTVKKIYQIKNREESKSLIILVSSINMLKKYVSVPKKALEILQKAERPTTIIYQNPKGLASNVISKEDNSVAIRIVQDDFCRKLIKSFKKPIVSTSANISGQPTPMSFSEIDKAILHSVDYVVNLHQEKVATKSSTILKIVGKDIVVLRE
ncbi:L-threonylcarbamoyladenylate synthase [Tenacibaculum sp. IB213877]|uniref:L-threonylcarbamoyladenylate synthase n=1 Tax=Tenacibaculum sp. IB213877 TaxID=3097351 RepID=UPI002A5A65E7|nr:L-threonylcarbamoyladenylate synthase [Tenacibaculum sp. IB213877]MDY0779626.1 L-threonylcarbamoyladenylate synthase [Tenacibaculum sp. IB213877]